jgi:hypothetical protein
VELEEAVLAGLLLLLVLVRLEPLIQAVEVVELDSVVAELLLVVTAALALSSSSTQYLLRLSLPLQLLQNGFARQG